jgi:probable HAF family extracellular repeat protein
MTRAIFLGTTAAIIMTGGAHAAQVGQKLDHYAIYTLSQPLGGTYAQGTSINLENDVAGYAALPGNAVIHATLWRNGKKAVDMGTLGGPNSAVAWPNRTDNGQYAGIAETSTVNPFGETWSCAAAVFYTAPPTGDVCLGFRWQNGTMSALPTLGGYDGFATGINNAGNIVGWAETTVQDPTCIAPQVQQFEAVIWNANNQPRPLPAYGTDPDSAATAINNQGQVVGISGICANAVGGASAEHMILWQNGVATNLGSLGGQYWNTPMDINENGDVTGFSDLAGDSPASPNFNAFLWTKAHGLQNLMALPNDTVSEGLGINDYDQIVGVSFPSGHAFLWQNGKMTDLNSLIPPKSKVVLIDGQDINDDGVITGEAQDKTTGTIYAFVAVPKWK